MADGQLVRFNIAALFHPFFSESSDCPGISPVRNFPADFVQKAVEPGIPNVHSCALDAVLYSFSL